ncbi:MAG TPA: YciI family protein [Chloroflexota bacterium]
MRYALLIYNDAEQWQKEYADRAPDQEIQDYGTYTQSLVQRGLMKGGEPLQSTTTATTVRIRGGQRLVTDGPFAETKEALGGFYLIEARDLDEAIELAAQCPGARTGSMEVRPIMELPPDYAMPTANATTA